MPGINILITDLPYKVVVKLTEMYVTHFEYLK